jgi:hypothetical protein
VTLPAEGSTPQLGLDYLDAVSDKLLLQAQWSGAMPYLRSASVPGTVEDLAALLPEGARLRFDQRWARHRTVTAELTGLIVEVESRQNVTGIRAVGSVLTAVESCLAGMVSAAEAAAAVPEGVVRMRFWSHRDDDSAMSSRKVAAPGWSEVATNYAASTASALAPLMSAADMTGRAGRLVLWHGEPGTGKTTAVRALSREWSAWCEAHYVTDPERLFADPAYLLQVAGVDDEEDDGAAEKRPWRLVIAEDCDEYLRTDAKLRAGASLGRLLNLCDGILGHGLQVLVLLTTNEDVGNLHPAITRPGRCLSRVEFGRLSRAQAQAWLGAGRSAPPEPATLAELYALREQRDDPTDRAPELGGYL